MRLNRLQTLALVAGAAGSISLAAVHTTMPGVKSSAVEQKASTSARLAQKQPADIKPFSPVSTPLKVTEPTFTPGLPVIYGSLVSAEWIEDYSQYGYYAFQPESKIKVQEIATHPNLLINGGGAYSDCRLHYHLWEMYADDSSETGITFNNYWCVVNTDNWSFVNTHNFSDYQDNITYDMTYDPTTGNLYAIQWGPYESDFCDFASIDKMQGTDSRIAKIPLMICLACDNFGNLYSVGYDGYVYYLDKTDGNIVKIGNTGLKPKYIQSATVDPETNVIYWAYNSETESALYTIDTHTGKANKVADMPGFEEFTALFVEAPRRGLDAPGALQNLKVAYESGKSVVTCNAPTKAFDGSALSGSVDVKLWVDGVLAVTKSVAPGAEVTLEAEVASGNHTLVVSASNAMGEGPQAVRSQYTGTDKPGPVGDLTLSLQGLEATLNWSAPTTGLNGGQVNPDEVEYLVRRYPGGDTIAEKYKELTIKETLPQGTATYYYTVTGYNEMGEGATAMSNSVFMGQAFTVPYTQDFEPDESLDGFTILNNEEERGWFRWHNTAQNFKAMAHKFTKADAADSWLILPSIEFSKNKEYKLKFNARVFSEEDPEKFEVTIGAGANVNTQTRKLLTSQTIKNEKNKTYEVPFTVDADGTWNIAFHCVSPMMSYYLIIDDIEVLDAATAPVTLQQPKPVTEADCSIYSNGNTVLVKWNAPTEDVDGTPLKAENLSYKVLASDGTVLADGLKECAFTDKRYSGTSSQRMVYYQIHAVNGDKESEPALTDMLLVGPDYSVPFEETFANTQFDKNPWVLSTVKGDPLASWGIAASASGVEATPVGNDGGMVYFAASKLPSGYEGRITSAKMNLSGAESAEVSFWVYLPGGEMRDRLILEITANDHVYIPLMEVDFNGEAGWKQFKVEVPKQYCKSQSSIAFHGVARNGTKDICVDQILVTKKAGAGVETLPIGLRVTTDKGMVTVTNESAEVAMIMNTAGTIYAICKPSETKRMLLPKGVIIVTCGGKSEKFFNR
ncbi:MAG: choice-of-anchor J domain-containing protein [Muribaculaceae bacterium]|nr:choice-of-anchor J domain-containing protein [Muribaculaceae bacterium]